jgi:hypothetical protein
MQVQEMDGRRSDRALFSGPDNAPLRRTVWFCRGVGCESYSNKKLFKRKYNFLRESPPVLSMSLWIIKLNV